MKILKSVGKVLMIMVLILSLAVPLVLIYGISLQEMEQYVEPPQGEYKPSAYGVGKTVTKTDMEEFIEVSGSFVSTSYAFQELNYENLGKVRWLLRTGDMVAAGDVLGLYEGKEVKAEVTGIIESMSLSTDNAYIQYTTMNGLELECMVDDKILSILEAGGIRTEHGEEVTVSYIAPMKNTNGTTTIRLKVEGGYIGQEVTDMKLFTGRIFYDVLVISEDCIYQKDVEADAPWYVRRISSAGYFIDEVEVELGYSNGEEICVTGVQEGDICDSGYKSILGQ